MLVRYIAIAILILLPTGFAEGQVDDEGKVTMNIGVGFTLAGPSIIKSVRLVDHEFDVPKDVFYLATSGAAKDLNLSDEQVAKMVEIGETRDGELFASMATYVDEDEGEEKLRQVFFAYEQELMQVLTVEQVDALEILKTKQLVSRVGIEELLQSSTYQAKFGLDESTAQSLVKRVESARTFAKANRKELLVRFNQELLDAIPESAKSLVEQILEQDSMREFCELELTQNAKRLVNLDATRLLKLNRVRRELEVDSQQYAQVLELREQTKLEKFNSTDGMKELKRILTEYQYVRLVRMMVLREAKKSGTVLAVTRGTLFQQMELDDRRTEELRNFAQQLVNDFKELYEQELNEKFNEALANIAPRYREILCEALATKSDVKRD